MHAKPAEGSETPRIDSMWAIAAAVGSLMMRMASMLAVILASLVACRSCPAPSEGWKSFDCSRKSQVLIVA